MYIITSDPKTILIHFDSSDNWFSFFFFFVVYSSEIDIPTPQYV